MNPSDPQQTRIPLRPLARILRARDTGENPDGIERENLRLRHAQMQDRNRRRSEWRLILLAGLFFAGFALIGARMGLLAASPPPVSTPWSGEEIADWRADIVDRNGRVLATNLVTHALYAELRYMIDGARAARELVRIFPELNEERLTRQLTDPNRRFVWIRSRLSPEQQQAVHDIGEPGLLFGARDMRLYPNGTLAAHVLGGASFGQQGVSAAEIVGVAGIEHRMDELLRDPARGDEPLVLSLDLTLQAVVEQVLANGVQLMTARAGSAVLMDIHSGEILAMASNPDFDPNHRPLPPTEGDPTDSPLFNHAVQGVYELGSVLKAFPVAQALELALVEPQTMIDIRGPLRIGRFAITDFRPLGNSLSVADIFIRSSNIGTARLAQMIGAERQREFLERFGLLEPSAIELAEAPRARPGFAERWGPAESATISYGHGLSTSPIMLGAAYAALINGGTRVQPTLLRRFDPLPGERLISAETSALMREMMRTVVTGGTASMGEVAGYLVGGKTGTAQKPNPRGGYYQDRNITTFVAAFPMDAPRYVLVVTLDEASETSGTEVRRTAGWTTVPVAAEIIRRVAPLTGLRPRLPGVIEAASALR